MKARRIPRDSCSHGASTSGGSSVASCARLSSYAPRIAARSSSPINMALRSRWIPEGNTPNPIIRRMPDEDLAVFRPTKDFHEIARTTAIAQDDFGRFDRAPVGDMWHNAVSAGWSFESVICGHGPFPKVTPSTARYYSDL